MTDPTEDMGPRRFRDEMSLWSTRRATHNPWLDPTHVTMEALSAAWRIDGGGAAMILEVEGCGCPVLAEQGPDS